MILDIRGCRPLVIINYLLVCLIFGTTFLAIQIGIDASMPPFFAAGIRFFTAGIVLFIYMWVRRRTRLAMLFRKELLLSGFGMTFVTFATLYWAEQYVPSGIAAVLSATGPIMILVLQTTLLKHRPTYVSTLGSVIGFAGVILLMVSKLVLHVDTWWVLGSVALLIGEFSYSSTALYSKQVTARFVEDSPIVLNAVQMMYGGAFLLLLALFTEHASLSTLISIKAAGSLLYLIVVGSMVGHTLFYWLVAKTNPVFPATWLYVSPPIALIIGVVFNHETINWVTIVGVVTIILGTILANWESLRQLLPYESKSSPSAPIQ